MGLRLARVDARPRYVVTALPLHLQLLARLSRIDAPRRRHFALRFANRWLMPAAHALAPGATGEIRLDAGGPPRVARFRAANPTFSWQYLAPWAGTAEIETLALLERLVGPDDAFIDVGANWGYFAHAIAARPERHGAVHAFEPHPGTYRDLVAVAADLGTKVVAHALALADRDGESAFDPGHRNDPGTARLTAGGTIAVRAARLDGLGLPEPTAIKIDVEGGERAVIDGARATLASARPFVVLENWPGAAGSAAALVALEALDYTFFLPCWAVSDRITPRLTADVRAARDTDGAATLALRPFDVTGRDSLELAQPNVLACPRERLGDLDSRLTAPQPGSAAPPIASAQNSA